MIVTFFRVNESTQGWHAADGAHAASCAIMAIAARLTLLPGDTITVRLIGDEQLPEASRASHFS